MTASLTVSFACNDDRGMFTHRFDGLEVYDREDHCASLACTTFRGPKLSFSKLGIVKVGRYSYPCSNRRRHEGNLIWDCCDIPRGHVELLIRQLHSLGWILDEWADTTLGPLIRELWP